MCPKEMVIYVLYFLKKRKNLKTMKARHWQFIPKENMSLISILYSQ